MMGKTHVVNSLAIAHTGLIGYTLYQQKYSDVPNTVTVFDFEIGVPLSGLEYAVFITVILLFTLLLLGIGKSKVKIGYGIGIFVLMLGLFFLTSDMHYLFRLTLLMLIFIFGSVLPDIDSEKSILGRYIKPISMTIPHRTITHTIWIVLLLGVAIWYFENISIYLLALTLGYTLHITQDTFSKQGIAWFYPIIGKYKTYGGGAVMKEGRKTPIHYEVGGLFEDIVFYASIGIQVILIIAYYIFL